MREVPLVALSSRSERHVRSWHALMDISPLTGVFGGSTSNLEVLVKVTLLG